LEELLLDFEDFLRHRRLKQWASDSPEALAVRQVPQKFKQDRSDQSDLTDLSDQERWALYALWLEHGDPAVRANALVCLIHQANYLLDQQIAALEKQFVEGGGYSEQLAAARLAERARQKHDPSNPPDPSDRIPACPQCGKPMALRTAKTGKNAGNQFWGCTTYPDCKGTAPV
jgi:four helix bundle suffix protein